MRTKAPDTLYVRAPRLNQLNILQQLASDPHLTQAELARRCNLSVAMVNNYMQELCALRLLEYRRKSSRNVTYYLTPDGEARIDSIRQELIHEMVDLFADAKARIHHLVTAHAPDGLQQVVLFGTGNLAELTFHALESAGINVLAICSDEPESLGGEWCGRSVLHSSQIRELSPDAVIVVDLERADEICQTLGSLSERGLMLIRLDGAPTEPPPIVHADALMSAAPAK
jgi:predicted transcriptional regulator